MRTEDPQPGPQDIVMFWVGLIAVTCVAGLYIGELILRLLGV